MRTVKRECAEKAGVDFVPLANGLAAVRNAVGASLKCPPSGLGDVLEAVFRYTGVATAAKVVGKITGKPCQCGQRRDALNRAFPL